MENGQEFQLVDDSILDVDIQTDGHVPAQVIQEVWDRVRLVAAPHFDGFLDKVGKITNQPDKKSGLIINPYEQNEGNRDSYGARYALTDITDIDTTDINKQLAVYTYKELATYTEINTPSITLASRTQELSKRNNAVITRCQQLKRRFPEVPMMWDTIFLQGFAEPRSQ